MKPGKTKIKHNTSIIFDERKNDSLYFEFIKQFLIFILVFMEQMLQFKYEFHNFKIIKPR